MELVAWIPLVEVREPEKELEPVVMVWVMRPFNEVAPEIEAVPITSRLVETEAVPGITKVLGMERVKLLLAPPSVAMIWLVVPTRALSKADEAVLPNDINGISLSK